MARSEELRGPRRRRVAAALGLAPLVGLAGCAASASTPSPQPVKVRVKTFPSAQDLPLRAALDQGFFAKNGLDVELFFTQNSAELRDGLASGDMHIVHAAVDNAVAMKEVAGKDIVVFVGGDSSLNEFFVQPEITVVEQLRGKTLIVDAADTAFALQAYEILRRHGLERERDYRVKVVGGTFARIGAMLSDKSNSASMLNPPFSLQAKDAGLRSLGGVAQLVGPYQALSGFALRPWARAHDDVMLGYVTAYVQGVRWMLDPANRARCIGMLVDKQKLAPALAERTYDETTDLRTGFAKDARFDDVGFANVLRLRGEHYPQGLTLPLKPERYVDMRWYDAAVAKLGRG